MHWEIRPPKNSKMGDHDVPRVGSHLEGRRIGLMICGGIAAMKTPMVARALRRYGADVVAYVSKEALKYVTKDTLEWATINPVVEQLSPQSEHLSKDKPIDAYLVAPATYNTINKIRHGIADTTITATMSSAIGLMERGRAKILIAPTMHGDMHNSILTESLQHLRDIGCTLIAPRDDYGKHNIPDNDVLVAETIRALSDSSVKGKKFLVTGGPTPVPIDNVRRITNRFRGRLGIEIAKELYFKGADVQFVLGFAGIKAPSYVPTVNVENYDAYKDSVLNFLKENKYYAGIFSAAVADYKPSTVYEGKIPSGGKLNQIELEPTQKVIDLARELAPDMKMISFKYQENMSHEELMGIAKDRISLGHAAVVANRGEDVGPNGEQVAYIVPNSGEEEIKIIGKANIARKLVEHIEKL
ncbi:MAG: bifunctional phosphopantothenoylcysteine decarboxylase/phosphopantothenate--cysteine ligase CoaBC [Bdellovibrionales bacterium]